MIYRKERILRDVRVLLDENERDRGLEALADKESLSLDAMIAGFIEEGARDAVSTAAVSELEAGHNFGEAVEWTDGGSGRIPLPEDFMRLIAFRMSDWERRVDRVVLPDDAAYGRLGSRYRGIRGNPQRPAVTIVPGPEGLWLEFHSCRSREAYVAEGVYTPLPRMDRNEGIEIPERVYRAVLRRIAALTAMSRGESERAEALMKS